MKILNFPIYVINILSIEPHALDHFCSFCVGIDTNVKETNCTLHTKKIDGDRNIYARIFFCRTFTTNPYIHF